MAQASTVEGASKEAKLKWVIDAESLPNPTEKKIQGMAEKYYDMFEEGDEMSGLFKEIFVEIVRELKAYSQGGLCENQTPEERHKDSWYKGFRPEDFKKLLECILAKYKENYAPWVGEAMKKRESKPGPSREEIEKLALFYKTRRKLDNIRFDDRGGGRELLIFAKGGRHPMGVKPADCVVAYETFLPEDFQALVEAIY